MRTIFCQGTVSMVLLGLSCSAKAGFIEFLVAVAFPATLLLPSLPLTPMPVARLDVVGRDLPGVSFQLPGVSFQEEAAIANRVLDDEAAEKYLAARINQRRSARAVRTALAMQVAIDKIGVVGDALAEELRDAKTFYQGKGPSPFRNPFVGT